MAKVTRSMPCRICGGPTGVEQTLPPLSPDQVRRKRRCLQPACGFRFVTKEVFERDTKQYHKQMGKRAASLCTS